MPLAGDLVTASDVAQLYATKTATESVTNSTTLQNDDELFVTLEASTTYQVDLVMLYDGAAAGDFKVGFTGPTAATLQGVVVGITPAGATSGDDVTAYAVLGTANNFGAVGTGTTLGMHFSGLLRTSTTVGALTVQWAQITASATATRVFADSYLALRRITA